MTKPANDNASTTNISGMTSLEILKQEEFVNSILDLEETMEGLCIHEWEYD